MPLILATKENQAKIAKALLDKRDNMEVTYQHGSILLSLAVKNGYFRAVEILLEKKANKNAVDKERWTSLNSILYKRYTQIIKPLLKK